MGRKPVISSRFIGNTATSNVEQGGGKVTVAVDYTSSTINVAQTDNLSIHIEWSASTLVADVYVQVRNGNEDIDNWRNLDFGTAITISGTSGEHEINILQMPFTDLRLFIDRASGSGQVGATFSAKALGN